MMTKFGAWSEGHTLSIGHHPRSTDGRRAPVVLTSQPLREGKPTVDWECVAHQTTGRRKCLASLVRLVRYRGSDRALRGRSCSASSLHLGLAAPPLERRTHRLASSRCARPLPHDWASVSYVDHDYRTSKTSLALFNVRRSDALANRLGSLEHTLVR